jgi:hypothetical protein
MGGSAAGGAIAIIVMLVLLWLLKRKNNKKHNAKEDASVTPPEEQHPIAGFGADNKHDNYSNGVKDIYQHQEPIVELPRDQPPPHSPSNRMSELDSIKPVSELSSMRPVSELESVGSSGERWSATHPARVVSPTLPDVAEIRSARPSPTMETTAEPAINRGHTRDVGGSSLEPPMQRTEADVSPLQTPLQMPATLYLAQ